MVCYFAYICVAALLYLSYHVGSPRPVGAYVDYYMTEGSELDVFWGLNNIGRVEIRAVSILMDEASVVNLSTPLDVRSLYPGFTMHLCRPNGHLSAKSHSHKISGFDRNRIILLCTLKVTDHLDAEFPATNRPHGLTESEFAFLAMLCLIELVKQGQ